MSHITHIVIVPITLAWLVSSCCSNTIELTRRYNSFETRDDKTFNPVALALAVASPDSAQPKIAPAILQLSDHGQTALIQFYASKSSVEELLGLLDKPFESAKAKEESDLTLVNKQLILSTAIGRPEMVSPADRIAAITLYFRPPADQTSEYSFAKWNRFVTEYGTVDLGTLSNETDRTFSAKLDPTFAGGLVGAGEVGGSTTQKVTESLVIKDRIVAISGILLEHEARVLQQGGIGMDLVGNTAVNLTVRLRGSPIPFASCKKLFAKDGAPMKPDEVELSFHRENRPFFSSENGLAVEAWAEYEFRHVVQGSATLIEGDDDVVQYRTETSRTKAMLMDGEALHTRASYSVLMATNHDLTIGPSVASQTTLEFATEQDASELLRWLHIQASSMNPDAAFTIGNKTNVVTIFVGKDELKARMIDSVDVAQRTNVERPTGKQ